MAVKIETILTQEFDRIGFYELMQYADLTQDLLVLFKERDAKNTSRELSLE